MEPFNRRNIMAEDRCNWFRNARFGAFIHWGLYSIPAGFWHGRDCGYCAEWMQARLRIPAAEYAKLSAQFNPRAYDPDQWCRMFRDAGMKYAVFTAKHHEGFAMFRTAHSPFNIVDSTPYGRDALAEFAAACRKYGLRLGIYYSHDLDWHEPDGGDPGPGAEKNVGGVSWGNDWDFPDHGRKDFSRYFNGKVLPQVTELLTNYGEVSLMWFDCPNSISAADSRKLRETVLRLQPQCLISGRIGNGCGDFGSLGDNQLPGIAATGLLECPATLNDTWGYKRNDHNWKSPHEVIGQLLELAGKHCNYLLNFGPDAEGRLPKESQEVLREVARWWHDNGDAFDGDSGNPFHQELDGLRVLAGEGRMGIFLDHARPHLELCGLENRILAANVPFRQDGDVISLDTAGLDGLWPQVRLHFDGAPVLSEVPLPMDGVLELLPNGNAEDWNHPGRPLAWRIRLPQPGRYQVACVSESARHSRPWCGERIVEFGVDGLSKCAQLQADSPASGRYYQRCTSIIGDVEIARPGLMDVTLRTTRLLAPEAELMNFIMLKIQRR